MTTRNQDFLRTGLSGTGSPSGHSSRLASRKVGTQWGGRKLKTLDRQERKKKGCYFKVEEKAPKSPKHKHNQYDEHDCNVPSVRMHKIRPGPKECEWGPFAFGLEERTMLTTTPTK